MLPNLLCCAPLLLGRPSSGPRGATAEAFLVGLGEGEEEEDDAGDSQWGENGPVFFTPASNASLLSVLIVGLGPGAGF